MTDVEAWLRANSMQTWLFNKLEIALFQGVRAAPCEVPVPASGWYVVRPVYNLNGMGLEAGVEYVQVGEVPRGGRPGCFWCEFIEGEHLSVDMLSGEVRLCVKAVRDSQQLWRFREWRVVTRDVAVPDWLGPDSLNRTINFEMIGGVVTEVHLRPNPNFHQRPYSVLRPVWGDEWDEANIEDYLSKGWVFVDDPDYTLPVKRMGFWAK